MIVMGWWKVSHGNLNVNGTEGQFLRENADEIASDMYGDIMDRMVSGIVAKEGGSIVLDKKPTGKHIRVVS